VAIKDEFFQNNVLSDFIALISRNYILDWEHNVSFGDEIISSLETKSIKLKYLLHLKRGDVLCLLIDSEETDLALFPVVWLGAEGIPHNATAFNFFDFLQLSYYGSGLLYDLNSVCFDYCQDKNLPDPEIIYNDERIKYSVENFTTKEQNYQLLLDWLKSKRIDIMPNPVQYIKKVAISIPIV